jgi:hypothetical protein
MDTDATFMPDAYNDLASFILSQFSSVTVIPELIPRIWVCTAPATAVLQTSELFTTTLGELAVGGVLFVTTVLLTVLVSLKADFVIKEIINKTKKVIKILFLIIF